MWSGPEIIETLEAKGRLRDYVVVALGTNGPVDGDALRRIYDIVGRDRHLVLVNSYAPRSWIPGVNKDLAAFATAHPGVIVADWAGAIAPREDLLAGDRIHPGHSGGKVFAGAVADAIATIENQRADVAYRIELMQWAAERAFPPEGAGDAGAAADGVTDTVSDAAPAPAAP
jgi:hypothetical protein